MKIFSPLQIAQNQRTLEQNKQYHWVVSPSLYVRISTGKVELQHDVIADIMESMGDLPMPDMGMPKPKGEWLLNGSLYAPEGTTTRAGQASVTFNEQKKSLNVFGDRHWQGGIPSSPTEFSQMMLDYKHAFGGDEFPLNPTGSGFKADDLPNVESSQDTITSNSNQHAPAGFAPLDPSWPQRAKFQGSYDQKYMEKFFPGYPEDMDWRLFMTAPEDQWFEEFFQGDEHFKLENMNPHKAVQQGQLPNLYPRCFIKDTRAAELEQFKEVDLHLDTVWFFPDKDIIQLIWRGGMITQDDEAEEISHMLLAYESHKDQRRSGDHYRVAMERRINDPDPLQDSLNTQDLIPLGEASAMQLLQQSALENALPSAFQENLETKASTIQATVDEQVAGALEDLKKQLASPSLTDEKRTQVLKQLDSLNAPAQVDGDSAALMNKLDKILPGLSSGKAKDLDLSDFSFKKIDDIFAEIDLFSTDQKAKMLEQVKPQIDDLSKQLQDNKTQEMLTEQQREIIQQQLDDLLALDDENLPLTLTVLPRLDIEAIKQQIATTTPELEKANQELHLMLSNPMLKDSDRLAEAKTKMEQLQESALSNTNQQLDDAKKGFLESYVMAAHFSDHGLSPHEDDDKQLKKLLTIVNGDKDASNQDWACLDLSGKNLDGMNFSNCLMEQVNFSSASLIGANFEGAVLARTDLTNANCTQANFNNANIGNSNCHHTNFTLCQFDQSKFSKTRFIGCSFIDTKITQPEVLEVIIEDSDFSNSTIKNFPFIELTLSSVRFNNATMETCNFISSNLENCSFDHASLPSTAWANTSVHNSSFISADMTSNCFVSSDEDNPCTFSGLNFSDAILNKANLQNLSLSNSIFERSSLESANFAGADLSHSNLDDCKASKIILRKANLNQASLKRANLMEGILTKAIITHTDLEAANLYAVDFLQATVKGTRFNSANLDATILKDWRPS
ncbi:MAG: DUF2169 domain-containing protein [Oleispira sp.]